jgi:hypothetical protein
VQAVGSTGDALGVGTFSFHKPSPHGSTFLDWVQAMGFSVRKQKTDRLTDARTRQAKAIKRIAVEEKPQARVE